MPEAKARSGVGGRREGIWGRRKGAQSVSHPPQSPQGHRPVLALAYLPPCRFHSTDVISGRCFKLFDILLGVRWQGSTAELPALAHTFCSLLSPSVTPGRMWPAVTTWRAEQRVGFMEQRAIFRRAQILPSRPIRFQATPRPSSLSYSALPGYVQPLLPLKASRVKVRNSTGDTGLMVAARRGEGLRLLTQVRAFSGQKL